MKSCLIGAGRLNCLWNSLLAEFLVAGCCTVQLLYQERSPTCNCTLDGGRICNRDSSKAVLYKGGGLPPFFSVLVSLTTIWIKLGSVRRLVDVIQPFPPAQPQLFPGSSPGLLTELKCAGRFIRAEAILQVS